MKNLEKNISRMNIPQNYEAPDIDILRVEVEKGFAESEYDEPSGNERGNPRY